MKKLGKSSKKGFTLVELIVVIVILAVLAAMLVPALIGYVDKARKEKDYQAASTVYSAAQAAVTAAYADGTIKTKAAISKTGESTYGTESGAPKWGKVICDLAGVTYGSGAKVTALAFTTDPNLYITQFQVEIENGGIKQVYEMGTNGKWAPIDAITITESSTTTTT